MRFVHIAAALAVLALPAAHAAEGGRGDKAAGAPATAKAEDAKKDTASERGGDRQKDAAAQSGGDPKKDARQAPSGGDDLTTCKRDADGMRGPERSTFMTRCLKERR